MTSRVYKISALFYSLMMTNSFFFSLSSAKFVIQNPKSLSMLPFNYPSKNLISRLLVNRDFLRLIPVETHALLAESNFRTHLSDEAVRSILWVHPTLPLYLTDRGLDLNAKYFTNLSFLKELSCKMYLLLALETKFVNRLSPAVLAVMAKNRRMWSCLPVEAIRSMLKESAVGSKITIKDILNATTQMSRVKSLDASVIANLFRYQMPRHAVSNIKYMISVLRS